MHLSYWSLLGSVAPVFVIVVAGFLIRRAGWLTAEADHSMLRVCVNVLMPCLILDSVLGNPALDRVENLTLPPLIGFASFFAGYMLSLQAAHLLRFPDKKARTFSFATGSYNYGYIAIPIVQAFFSRETIGVIFTHNLGVEIAFWTVGFVILTGTSAKRAWTKIFNPPVVAIVFSLALNFCGGAHWLPQFVPATAHMLGQTAVPLALVLAGATLADGLRKAHPRMFGVVSLSSILLRLGALPVLFLVVAKFLPCSIELKRVMVVQAAMPAAMLPIIFARHFDGDVDVATEVVLATSVAGLLTIPWWIRFGFHFVGI